LGIEDGDLVRIETPRGYVIMRAKLTHGIHPRVIGVQHGWEGEANDNRLTDNQRCSEGMGSTTLRGLLCRVRRVAQ
jgi:anaerobic selenocysteine-containing dehydrogenase